MWLIVMFDLPVTEPEERKAAHDFRMSLLDEGFSMAQYSIYFRFCTSQAQSNALSRRIIGVLPKGGKVDLLVITDKQYENIRSFRKGKVGDERKNPEQFVLL
jgi:CRISPR-associated protein Cas2